MEPEPRMAAYRDKKFVNVSGIKKVGSQSLRKLKIKTRKEKEEEKIEINSS